LLGACRPGGRAHHRGGADRTAVLYDGDGQALSEHVPGDGIARALAAADSRVALSGGYGPEYDRLALTELGADRAQPAGEYRVVLPDGEPLPAGTRVIGRGRHLHFLTDTSSYQLDVDDIPA
jgi:hypothetical protein